MDGVFSVGDVVRYLRDILDEDVVLSGLWIQGEVSNLSQSSSGHTYFTLKDEECQLKCVLFRGAGRAQAGVLKHGAHVLVHGRVGVYETQGTVQLYVDLVQAGGMGSLHRRFEELCDRLRAEGLFAEEHKRPLPVMPRRVGVVTSAQGAAFQDICKVIGNRFPVVEIVLAPTLVQGEEAAAQIATAILHLATIDHLDVIIVARGGGSLEDLWAFNDERVARAIVASPIPVVTGIGHETDTTIADYAADVRAPTPSGAAMLAVPDRQDLLQRIAAQIDTMERTLNERLQRYQATIKATARELEVHSPARRIAQQRQRVDDLAGLLQERVLHAIALRGERLGASHTQLKLLDPVRTLDRGYAMVTAEDGTILRAVAGLRPKDRILIRMRDGSVPAEVTGAAEIARLARSRGTNA
jgi:exodeoxyribonuclease VII large subunit